MVDSDEEEELDDRSIEMVYKYQLGAAIIEQFESVSETAFPVGSLKRELADEIMDMIESEFFAGALYELCQASFNSTIQGFLAEQLSQGLQLKK